MVIPSTPISVLHVDDEVAFTDLVAAMLEREDDRLEVHTVTSAPEALDRLDDDTDCLVSDYDMPRMDGIELLRAVRETYPELPFVLFTGKGSEEIASEAVSAGVTDYLQKSGGTEQYELLANKLRNAVETARGRRARHKQLEAIETAQEGIGILDEGWRFVYVNEAYADLYGYDPEEMIGEDWELIYPAAEAEFAREHVIPAIEDRGYWHGETIGLRADGDTFVEAHALSVTGDGGLVCTVRDVTDRKAREQDLARKTRALDEAPVGITLSDPRREDNPLVYANEQFEALTGYDESAVLGSNCRFLQGEGTDPDRVAQLREAVDAGRQAQVDIRNYRADGTAFWNRVTIAPIEDDTGHVTGWVGFQQDVTDHHERVEALERYRRIVDTMEESACLYDEAGRFVVVNERLAEFYDTAPEALEGQQSTLLSMIREAAEGDPYAALVAGDRQELRGEVEGTFPERGRAVVDYRLTRLSVDGEFTGVVGVARDITDRRERERTLERENERLEEFASIVSHDLRNPLSVAESHLELAREECDSPHLDDISRAHTRMETLVEDLLTLARSGESVADRDRVGIEESASACWHNVETGDATLTLDCDLQVRADGTRLEQLLENLVRNAVEHGGETVSVTVGTLDAGSGFYVADDGPGIPEAEREAVFESGYSTSQDGTGFGLKIVSEIADVHGWDVSITESAAGGARFEVSGVETV